MLQIVNTCFCRLLSGDGVYAVEKRYGAGSSFHKGVFGMKQQQLCHLSPSGMQGGEPAVLWRKDLRLFVKEIGREEL